MALDGVNKDPGGLVHPSTDPSVRHGLRRDLVDLFLDDMGTVVARFVADPDRRPDTTAPAGFSHA